MTLSHNKLNKESYEIVFSTHLRLLPNIGKETNKVNQRNHNVFFLQKTHYDFFDFPPV